MALNGGIPFLHMGSGYLLFRLMHGTDKSMGGSLRIARDENNVEPAGLALYIYGGIATDSKTVAIYSASHVQGNN